ncbi:MAG: TonB-dependent receptor [Reichenbachiella sp.]|uniref:TonB-dependent receptor n=2 Tax=Reichenbachiella sp. TaxID=2184521 RepID=UPI00329A572F
MQRVLLFLVSFQMVAWVATGQTITGLVVDEQGDGVPGSTVLMVGTNNGAVTDVDGRFILKELKPGTYQLQISSLGNVEQIKQVEVAAGKTTDVSVIMEPDATSLQEVTIYGKSEATVVREQAYAVAVVEAKEFKNVSTDVNQILNRVSGINIRQSGGMGSNFNLSLNGLSGNRVRTFINGIPMDYFGSSLSLNNFPANLISTIEIYKGAVPIHLSSDALGGSINIITDTRPISYLDASYSFGSFNTHTAALNGQWHHANTGLTLRVKSFYNHSDNDYPIDINLLDIESGKLDEETTEIKRFHDAYTSKMAWIEAGVMNKPYADELMIGTVVSDNYKELQQNPYATGVSSFPVGEAFSASIINIYNLSYRKKNLFIQNLNVRGYGVYLKASEEYRDVSPHRYDWFGNYEPDVHPTTGELGRKTHFYLDRENYLANLNAEYQLAPAHNVSASYSLNRLILQGKDDHQPQNNTQFNTPNIVTKQVIGMAYSNQALNKRLKTTVFAKRYQYDLKSNNADYSGDEEAYFETQITRIGYGLASTFFLKEHLQLKASFEKAFRFPESGEMYGDGLNVIPNPTLQPETSYNYNIGVRLNQMKAYTGYVAEANVFVRDSRDYIRFEPKMNRSTYVNDPKVLAVGVDLSLNYRFDRNWTVGFGGTYLDLRNNDETSTVYQDRLPNEPYLFGNLIITYRMTDLLGLNNELVLTNSNRYVNEFYLKWPSLAASGKSSIPTRLTNDLQLTYSLQEGKYNVSLLVANVLDAEVYDNFNQQNPGRSFNLKLRYFISKN